ncbi:MAG TPA: antibiotic biosynthesis monooxygenase [Myxococcota bacterium]|nr:antibiotic biosynthesis monooxygenase [Myxococcales bacterium]HPG28376.1 antibiotic biosynthesis monooxygenase [Myxococcota bacterium]
MSQAFAFITHVRAKPGKRAELMAANARMQAETAKEEGVPIYAFHTASDSPDDFWYYDYYETQAAYEAHNASPVFKEVMGQIMQLADIVEVARLDPFGPVKSGPVEG